MIANPVIDLYRNPVATLTALGYAALLATAIWFSTVGMWRNGLTIKARWDNQRPHQWQYVPPLSFVFRVAAIPALLWIDAWLLAALIWLVF